MAKCAFQSQSALTAALLRERKSSSIAGLGALLRRAAPHLQRRQETALVRSDSVPAPNRWIPSPRPVPSSSTPLRGWAELQRWKEKSLEKAGELTPVTGCTELVRQIRKAQRRSSTPNSLWRYVAARGGSIAEYFGPQETCEILTTLADVRLQWESDPDSTNGLILFAHHAAQEIGSYSAVEMGALVVALGKLNFQHEDLMQSLSRAVERSVKAESGRIDNATLCAILKGYLQLGVLDQQVMKNLSRLVVRRLVREPMTPSQTAGVVVAFAELRFRDLGLFNATTLALTRKGAVEALSWMEMSSVASSYAVLRLHSESLFGRIRSRVLESAGLHDEYDLDDPDGDAVASPAQILKEALETPVPIPPPVGLPDGATAQFLEAQLHLDHVTLRDLAPLLPHLAHPSDGHTLQPEAAVVLLVALSNGGHAHPWLWVQTASAFRANRLPASSLISMAKAMSTHLAAMSVLTAEASGRRRKLSSASAPPWREALLQHMQFIAANLPRLWSKLTSRCPTLTDVEIQRIADAVLPLTEAQDVMVRYLEGSRGGSFRQVAAPLRFAAAKFARRLAVEQGRRGQDDQASVEQLLRSCGVRHDEVKQDMQQLADDAIVSSRAASHRLASQVPASA